ncbi:hypothetical protein CSAL01_00394 [Colletotrichum salicis]|uniref:Uncharacterized protein n=1 Tax=Colletotrichum salicis TaxID=1209931 RepID=A0A135SFZ0_9PEZI|nr:hypothetical protein CSAL01_00394 [Colletotrichum salicis]
MSLVRIRFAPDSNGPIIIQIFHSGAAAFIRRILQQCGAQSYNGFLADVLAALPPESVRRISLFWERIGYFYNDCIYLDIRNNLWIRDNFAEMATTEAAIIQMWLVMAVLSGGDGDGKELFDVVVLELAQSSYLEAQEIFRKAGFSLAKPR